MVTLSDSITITRVGNEEEGIDIVLVDGKHKFAYPYSLENPPLAHNKLAEISIAKC